MSQPATLPLSPKPALVTIRGEGPERFQTYRQIKAQNQTLVVDLARETDAHNSTKQRAEKAEASHEYSHQRAQKLLNENESQSNLPEAIAKEGGEYCGTCHGTLSIVRLSDIKMDAEELRDYAEMSTPDFLDEFPDECDSEHCFGGYELKASE